jgi:hypothetical protein
MSGKTRSGICLVSLFFLALCVSAGSVYADVSVNASLTNASGLYAVKAEVSPPDAKVKMEFLQGDQRVARVKVKQVEPGIYEGVIYEPLSAGMYTVKVKAVRRVKSGEKEETSTTVALNVTTP